MNVLPVVGLLLGVAVGDRRAFPGTALLAGVGLALVAALTDEIDGWGDPYPWIIVAVSLVTTAVGIGLRRAWRRRRSHAG